jgi:hypothetical protein
VISVWTLHLACGPYGVVSEKSRLKGRALVAQSRSWECDRGACAIGSPRARDCGECQSAVLYLPKNWHLDDRFASIPCGDISIAPVEALTRMSAVEPNFGRLRARQQKGYEPPISPAPRMAGLGQRASSAATSGTAGHGATPSLRCLAAKDSCPTRCSRRVGRPALAYDFAQIVR